MRTRIRSSVSAMATARLGGLMALTAMLGLAGCGDDFSTGQNPGGQNNPGTTETAAQAVVRPLVLSETGHDRLLGAAFDAQGNIYATGMTASGTATTDDFSMVLVKLRADGSRDASFGNDGVVAKNVVAGGNGELARGIVVQSTGKIVIAGTVEHAGAADARDRDVALVRFNADGTVDSSFGSAGVALFDLSTGEVSGTSFVADAVWGLTRLADDRLVFVGAQKATGRADTDFAVVRLSADGAFDNSFGTNGKFTLDIDQKSATPKTATVLPGGKLLVSGYMRNAADVTVPVLFRLTEEGALDTTFATGGVFDTAVLGLVTEVYATALQGNRIVTAGYGRNTMSESLDWLSLGLNESGMLDSSYGANGVARIDRAGFNDNARNIVSLPDNRVLIVGGGRAAADNSDAQVAVLTPNGQPDAQFFGTSERKAYDLGGDSDAFWGVAVSPDGKKVAVVGHSGSAANSGQDDDAALLLLPL